MAMDNVEMATLDSLESMGLNLRRYARTEEELQTLVAAAMVLRDHMIHLDGGNISKAEKISIVAFAAAFEAAEDRSRPAFAGPLSILKTQRYTTGRRARAERAEIIKALALEHAETDETALWDLLQAHPLAKATAFESHGEIDDLTFEIFYSDVVEQIQKNLG